MTSYEKKITKIISLFGCLFFALISIAALLLRYEVQPFYDLSLNFYAYKKISGGLIIVPALLSALCLINSEKYK